MYLFITQISVSFGSLAFDHEINSIVFDRFVCHAVLCNERTFFESLHYFVYVCFSIFVLMWLKFLWTQLIWCPSRIGGTLKMYHMFFPQFENKWKWSWIADWMRRIQCFFLNFLTLTEKNALKTISNEMQVTVDNSSNWFYLFLLSLIWLLYELFNMLHFTRSHTFDTNAIGNKTTKYERQIVSNLAISILLPHDFEFIVWHFQNLIDLFFRRFTQYLCYTELSGECYFDCIKKRMP